MMSRRVTAIFGLVLVLCLTGSALVVHQVDRIRAGATLEEVLYFPSSKVLKRMSLGFNGLLADIYWTRAVQYFGSKHHAKATQYKLLAPLLDITTDLDPHLIPAYQFGAIFLSQQPPEGAGQPEQAVALVEKGIRANPDRFHLYLNLGWIQYSELKDHKAAARSFEAGSNVKGAPPALKVLAAAMAQRGGDPATARLLWTQLYETTEDRSVRANAVKRLQAMKVDEEVPLLEGALQAFKNETGRYPTSWDQLYRVGWRGSTVDPMGHPYRIMSDGRVEVADPDSLPFITRGLPPGTSPVFLDPTTAKQQEAIKAAEPSSSGSLPANLQSNKVK